jgi:hypothetical protein
MRRAAFSRAEYSPRRLITKLFQFCNNLSESESDMSFDILEEAKPGSHPSDSVSDVRPEVTGIV